MRIGMILETTFPPDSRVEKEALSLIEDGHEVFLFNLNYSDKPDFEVYKGIKICRYPAGRLVYKFSAIAYPWPFYKWFVAPLIKEFIRQHAIEVVHIHDIVIADSAVSVSGNLPIVLDLHENRPEIMRDYKHVKSLAGRILVNIDTWKKKYYELVLKAKLVIVVTELAKKDLIDTVNKESESISVVPNTIMKSEFLNYPVGSDIQNRMAGTFNVLYIGDTSVRRGTRTAIEAIKILEDKIPSLKLWIVGSSSADTELKDLIDDLEVGEFIKMEGWQDFEHLPSYIQFCHVAISPLLRNVHHDTTFANKIFQYMALGKPLVVSDCIAQAQLVETEKCGMVHKAGDAGSLAACIQEIFADPAKALNMGTNGREAVLQRWNWENTVKPLRDAYNRIGEKNF